MTTINNSEVEALYVTFFLLFLSLGIFLILLLLLILIFRCTLICSVFAGAVAVVFNCTARIYLFLIIDRTFIIVFSVVVVAVSFVLFVRLRLVYGCYANWWWCCRFMKALRSEGTQKCAQAKMNISENQKKNKNEFLNMQQFRSGPVDNRILLLLFSTPRPHENRWRERSSLFRFYFNHIFFSFVAFVSFSGCRMAACSTVRSILQSWYVADGPVAAVRYYVFMEHFFRSFTNRMAAFARATTFRYSMANILTRQPSRPCGTRKEEKTEITIGRRGNWGWMCARPQIAIAHTVAVATFGFRNSFQMNNFSDKKQCIQRCGYTYYEMESIAYHIRSHIYSNLILRRVSSTMSLLLTLNAFEIGGARLPAHWNARHFMFFICNFFVLHRTL